MAQTLTRILVHVIFSTKNRRNLITPEIEPELFPYMAAISRNHESPILAINGTANHVHSVVSLSKNIALADLLEVVKKDSSKWIKKQSALFRDFHWQAGYGGFSIGESQLRTVKDYIARQKVKHRTISFEDEFRAFLKKYNVPTMSATCGINLRVPSARSAELQVAGGITPGESAPRKSGRP